ncbi:hypothetical protein N7532_008432 [Penicillium argentinense]|uniref:Uncharacterized protein n=1 Tax=Penicillium argentinense TaxID=1131581 RepID=A0A9W9EXA8_9EURO|nr:uncharacterized protein N7532_008432 [Penicillium argentinense]KAJ5089748.1 hypothetical protein N7532_008432 [Penicillium argentinense]
MSRNLFPVVIAIGVGVFTGYYTFQPSFQQLAIDKAHGGKPSTPQFDTGSASPASGVSPKVHPQTSKPAPGEPDVERSK